MRGGQKVRRRCCTGVPVNGEVVGAFGVTCTEAALQGVATSIEAEHPSAITQGMGREIRLSPTVATQVVNLQASYRRI